MENVKKIHFVGIKGVAMTALAIYAKERGMIITGSDIHEEFPTDEMLRKSNISVMEGFVPRHIASSRPDMVVYTGAHNGRENVEVSAAIEASIPTFPHGKALGMIMRNYRQISVAGSHGKTTTAAMIATILTVARKDPSYVIGCGEIFGLGAPGHFGRGEFFVAEADEYATDPTTDPTPRFLWQHPEVLVVTNIDFDHPDIYASLADVQDAFITLQAQQVGKKITVINASDLPSSILGQSSHTIITFGDMPKGNFEVSHTQFTPGKTLFILTKRRSKKLSFELSVPGVHNVLNAAAAASACISLGIDWGTVQKGLMKFSGTKRRFESLGTKRDILFYDDYAHHPAEIVATITGAKMWYPQRRIITIFQPHTYSRTKALLGDFARAFSQSDIAIMCDIYASAREHDHLGLSPDVLFGETKKYHANVVYAPGKNAVKTFLLEHGKVGDVVIFMGAGDIFSWGRQIVKEL